MILWKFLVRNLKNWFRSPESYYLGHLYAESNQKDKLKLAQEYLEKVTKSDPRDWESIIDYAQVLERNRPDKSLEGTGFNRSGNFWALESS